MCIIHTCKDAEQASNTDLMENYARYVFWLRVKKDRGERLGGELCATSDEPAPGETK